MSQGWTDRVAMAGSPRATNEDTRTVFVVDHEEETRRDVSELLRSVEIPVVSFDNAPEFLNHYTPHRAGALVLDARLPGMGGLELQERLASVAPVTPVIIVTAHGDIPSAVRAMRNGAVDFIEKPFRPQALLECVYHALERGAIQRRRHTFQIAIEQRAAQLTPREREVMQHVVCGLPNKAIALRLRVTRKAVEAYRARAMRKMDADSLAELVRMNVFLAGNVEQLERQCACILDSDGPAVADLDATARTTGPHSPTGRRSLPDSAPCHTAIG
jgi:two-component system response regulator FixJ